MGIVLLGARIVLALVFSISAVAKIADREGSRRAIDGFGIPLKLAGALAVALPIAEIAVAVALIPSASAWWGALGAFALLAVFVTAIGVNLARGRKPACHCFGQLHSEPVGWPTLLRNGGLAAAAGLILWQGRNSAGLSAVGWIDNLATSELVSLGAGMLSMMVLGVGGWFVLQLLRQNGRLLLRIEALEAQVAAPGSTAVAPVVHGTPQLSGLPIGSMAPGFELSNLNGEPVSLDGLRSLRKPVLLLFSDPGCGPCDAILPDIGQWQREHVNDIVIALVSRGDVQANRTKAAQHQLSHVLLQANREVANQYQAYGTPNAILVSPDGTIGSTLAQGADRIRDLVARLLPQIPSVALNGNGAASQLRPTAPQIGDDAPAFTLSDLSGNNVSLSDYRGADTMLLFWNPGCGFCQRMLPDLKALETNPSEDTPTILVVSTGSVEANQAMGLRSQVLLDQGFSTGQAFGSTGTPSSILVDARGKIASQVAVGASSVVDLLANHHDTLTAV